MRRALPLLAAALASTRALDKSPIVRQLNASLSWYDTTNPVLNADDRLEAAKQWLRGYLWNRSNTVLILDNRILVDGEFLRSTGDKGRRHLRFLATLVYSGRRKINKRKISRQLPNSVYHFNQLSTGEGCPADHEPCLVIAKDKPTRPGILVPNPYFGDMRDWHEFQQKLRTTALPRKFVMRLPRAFWRGAIMNYDHEPNASIACQMEHGTAAASSFQQMPSTDWRNGSASDSSPEGYVFESRIGHLYLRCDEATDGTPTGNYARLQALAETLKHPEAVDARCVFAEACRPRKNGDRCRDMPYDRSMERVVEQPEVLSSGEFVYEPDYSKYKYVLNLPGSTLGGYSRNLNHLWAIGSVVLQWRSVTRSRNELERDVVASMASTWPSESLRVSFPRRSQAQEWYYPSLKSGETHVDVDDSNLVQTVQDLERDVNLAYALRRGADAVAKELVCAQCITDYFVYVLRSVRQRWAQDLILDDPCVLHDFLEEEETQAALNCSSLDLMEVISRYDARLQSRSHSWHHSGKSWEHPDQHQGPWLHPEEIPAKPYGSYTHSIVDAKPLGEGCRALLKHSAHACAAHRAHHVEKEGDDDIE